MRQSDAGALAQIREAASAGQLVVVVGTGLSLALTDGKIPALSWRGLIEDGFRYGQDKGRITSSQAEIWQNQLNSNDLDDLLGAAEFVTRKLEGPGGELYARWLKSTFESAEPVKGEMVSAVRALASAGIPLCTVNYDTLLETITDLPTINFGETQKISGWMRREYRGILHLHGSWDAPATCVLGIRDYEATLGSEVRDLIQRTLGSFSRLLFIGCGGTFSDPNFSALINWLRQNISTAAPQHYALVSDDEVATRNKDPAWQGFVDPISYGADHSKLSDFLLAQFPLGKKPARKSDADGNIWAANAKLLDEYRAFLLRDCGQMTIEGVRADMVTAQRRFDLERLFVPLKVLASPPEIPITDPNRAEKLHRWQEENNTPLAFGVVFEKHSRLALLALPGGGKSLLLKRLAVAYADPGRRQNSDDKLPSLDLFPVLIRCREWREHIRRPLPVIFKNIDMITGHASLANFGDALVPLLETGRVLLLVDGLDEIHNDADRSIFVNHLESFLDEYTTVRLVVTSREAGFSLVAPHLGRFCERWKMAPLDEEAITALCDHWHLLMKGSSSQASRESHEVARAMLRNKPLRRLAENPLLLTMLLVVKHGAGRLPPDRVSLYERAVEVLLDTWNIEGHDPLNPKEAVPQLAFVAFQLMRQGKQTATEKELLSLLEEAREHISQIRRYAKDSPDEFLKRVELRSSLLVEAGHQMEGARAVPFYQFRHLTFQEYLAAVAAVEGHYLDYSKEDTSLTPLAPYLTAEEWKEVVPMAAVLAKKQAEPIMAALVREANASPQDSIESVRESDGERFQVDNLPPPAARLLQCLIEEAQASPETLTAAFQALSLFARDPTEDDGWPILCRGPYGSDLIHQTWSLYRPMNWPRKSLLRNTLAEFWSYQQPVGFWKTDEGKSELFRLLGSQVPKDNVRGLLIIASLQWGDLNRRDISKIEIPTGLVDDHLFNEEHALWHAAVWAWALIHRRQHQLEPSVRALERLLALWLNRSLEAKYPIVSFAFGQSLGRPRHIWRPTLSNEQKELVHSAMLDENLRDRQAALMISFHSREVLSDRDLAILLQHCRVDSVDEEDRVVLTRTLDQLSGPPTSTQPDARRKRARRRN